MKTWTPLALAEAFSAQLQSYGFETEIGPALPYGQKILLGKTSTGQPRPVGQSTCKGTAIVYVGKRGPSLVFEGLIEARPEEDARLMRTVFQTVVQPALELAGSDEIEPVRSAPAKAAGSNLPSTPVVPRTPATKSTSIHEALASFMTDEDEDDVEVDRNPLAGLHVYVDGACTQQTNGLRFGWGFVVLQDGQELIRRSGSGTIPGSEAQRNVGAEMQAVLHALAWLRIEHSDVPVTIHHDYLGLAAWPTGQWKAKNVYTQSYASMVQTHPAPIDWVHVKGHSGEPFNELADALATAGAEKDCLFPHP